VYGEKEAAKHSADYEIVTGALTKVPVASASNLSRVQSTAYRAMGTSSVHAESNRSHTVSRFDIVTHTLLEAMKKIEMAERIKPATRKRYNFRPSLLLKKRLEKIQATIEESNRMCEHDAEGRTPFGGQLLLVDLSGRDADHRSVGENGHSRAQRKESSAINQSLLALKE